MTTAQMESYRRLLLTLKMRLGADISSLEQEVHRPIGSEGGGGLSDVPIHPADLGADNEEEEVSLTLLAKDDQVLDEINAALDRIDNGTFGGCQECGEEIVRKRLKILPYTRHCVSCAERLQDKQHG